MDPTEAHAQDVAANIAGLASDQDIQERSIDWIRRTAPHRYTYNFAWSGRPIIQLPQDMVAMQELIWQVRPDIVVETGIAHGGSLVFTASMLANLDYCDALESDEMLDPRKPKRRVIGIDIDIRAHNRAALDAHPMRNRMDLIEGSSIDPAIVSEVRDLVAGYDSVLVCLDSNHTHAHVLSELEAYASLVTPGSYCVVFDTVIENMPEGFFPDRPWDRGDNPKTAVWEYLESHSEFEIDKSIQHKLQITVAPDGYLRRLEVSS